MTLPRIALYCTGLILALLLGASLYYYQNFPSLVEEQARRYLQEYGVQSLDYEDLRISHEQLTTDTLHLRGEYAGMAYEATLSSLQVRYDWRALLIGEVQSVTLDGLELDLTDNKPGDKPESSPTVNISSMLPQPYIAALPLNTIDIHRWDLRYSAPDLPPVSATGSLQLNQQLRVKLRASQLDSHLVANIWTEGDGAYPRAEIELSDGDTRIGNLGASLQAQDHQRWQWSLAGKLNYAPLLSWLRRLEQANALAVDISGLGGLILVGDSEFTAQIRHPEELYITEAAGQLMLMQFDGEAHSANNIEQLDYPAAVSGLSADLDISMSLSGGETRFTLKPTELNARIRAEALSLAPETLAWLRWGETVPLRWRSPEDVIIRSVDENGWSLQLRNNAIVLGKKDSELRLDALVLNSSVFPGDELQLSASINARLNARLRKNQLPPMNLALTHSGSFAESDFTATLDDVAQSMSLGLQGKANLEIGHGRYLATFSSQDLPYASETVLPLMQGFGLLGKSQSIEISSGRMTLESTVQSRGFELADLTQRSQLKIENLAGAYEDYRFEGVAVNAEWTGIERWQTKGPLQFSMAKLDMGFEVLNTSALLSLPKATPITEAAFTIESLSSGMFGGRVFLPQPQPWDLAAETNHFTLRAEGWRLADMVALQQGQDIRAQGILEGELPVTMTGGRIIIRDGYLRAQPPGGSIRYIANEAGKALASSSPELGLAMDLLSDFQFEVLSSKVDLDEDGNLLLGLSLSGKNPAQYEGRPINFNINLEQNLDPLLQSLRLSDKLVEQLEGRIN